MKTVIIKEFDSEYIPVDNYTLNLSNLSVKNCIGCWSCWWKTPGQCAFSDLNQFYHEYITADKAIYFVKAVKGFVSGNLKTLFDRMIPLYLPYMDYSTGESMHVPRYEKYPDIEFYYYGEFETEESRKIYEDYINRVFYQFHSANITVLPYSVFSMKKGK
jgi:hypothetical protein